MADRRHDGAHGNGTHGDETHGDGTHGDGTHGGGARSDGTHGDGTHGDGTHGDGTHGDGARGNGARGNGHRYALTTGEAGSAGGQTLIAAVLPVLLAPHAPSTFWIGAVIATEGLFAMVVPYLSGAVSDALPRRFRSWFGPRGALLALTMPFMALSLLLLPFRDNFWALAGIAVIYFAALHAYSTPLRAMLIEVTPPDQWGTVQGVMGATHLAGVTFGLVAGGVLFSVWEPLPFLVGGGLVAATTSVTLVAAWQMRLGAADRDNDAGGRALDAGDGGGRVAERAGERGAGNAGERAARNAGDGAAGNAGDGAAGNAGDRAGGGWELRREIEFWRDLLRDRTTRRFLMANVLWNGGTEGIRPYLFLFATAVLGIAMHTASLAMLAFLGAAAAGSVVVGHMGDRFGRGRVLLAGAIITGLAMLPGFFVRDLLWLLVLLVPAGLGAAALVSLPYPVFAGLAGDSDIGRSTGAFYMSVGLARLIAPLAIGAAIDIAAGWMPEEKGYPIMWPAAGVMVLLGAAGLWISGVEAEAEGAAGASAEAGPGVRGAGRA